MTYWLNYEKIKTHEYEGVVTSIKLNKKNVNLLISSTLQLNATVLPENSSSKKIKWVSSNINVAVVSSTGKITAKRLGIAVISAISSNQSKVDTCKITVIQPVKSLALSKTKELLKKGKFFKLIASVLPSNASNKKVIWKSSNSEIVSVSANGVLYGVGKGTVYIQAISIDSMKVATCKVVVY